MKRDSLLPKSLFSASTLKTEPVQSSVDEFESQERRLSRESLDVPVAASKRKRSVDFRNEETPVDEDQNSYSNDNGGNISSSDSSSSSSSSSSDEEDFEQRTTRRGHSSASQINRSTSQLLLKLERQQSKQNKYLSKLKNINKSIRNTSRLLGRNASLASSMSSAEEESRTIAESSRKSSAAEEPQKQKRRIIRNFSEDLEEDDDVVTILDSLPQPERRRVAPEPKRVVPESSRAKTEKTRASQPRIVPTRKDHVEIELGKSNKIDTFTIRKKQNEVVFGRKPRSLLYNVAPDTNSDLSDLLITTSMDGDLQFWNKRLRKNIKTIGNSHIYDKFIENICWATPSTLALIPAHKAEEPLKLIHIGNVRSNNVEGYTQTLQDDPHDSGISAIASVDLGSFNGQVEKCSFVTGGYDKSVYLWSLRRDEGDKNFSRLGTTRLNIKHTSTIFCMHHDKSRNHLFTGGADERFIMYDMQTDSSLRELRLHQRVSSILQSKANPSIMLVTVQARSEQFLIYDVRSPMYDGIKLKFGQVESETSRYITPDIHENGYTVACGSQSSSKLNFWDIRYTGVSHNPSFTLDTGGSVNLRTLFIPNTKTITSVSSNRSMTWLDYGVEKDVVVKSFT